MLEVERYRSDRHDAINDSEKKDRASQFNFQRVGERDSNYQPERSVPYYSSNRRSSRSRSPTYNYHERHYNDYGRDNFHGRNHHEGNSDRYREDRDRYRYKDDNDRRNERRGREYPSVHHNPSSKATVRSIAITKLDDKLPQLDDDPRFDKEKGVRYAKMVGGGRNTESFDPKDTLVRPDLRVIVGPNREQYGRPLKHDDVVIVPEFFCKEDDWDLYYKLVAEIRELNEKNVPNSQFISWHEGAHLIVKDPSSSPTFQKIQEKIANYFAIPMKSVGTRFNWYRDSSDFKPFHHDSAAFNPHRARNQNITVGVSFGSTRELAFLHAESKNKTYFPQTNGMLFSFGRDVNIRWKHGINALPDEEQDGRGRVSIVLWGLAPNCVEESESPPLLNDNTRGNGHSIHARNNSNKH